MCDMPKIVTTSGLEQLRQLEDMRRKELTLVVFRLLLSLYLWWL